MTIGKQITNTSGQPGPYFSAGLCILAALFPALVHLYDCIYIHGFKVCFRHSAGHLVRQGHAPKCFESIMQVGWSEPQGGKGGEMGEEQRLA